MSEEAASVAASAPQSEGAHGQTGAVVAERAAVPELAETLDEDGRLLKMFVTRNNHLESDAKEKATRDWLIRSSFYDRWLDEFVRRYAPASAMLMLADEDMRVRLEDIQKSCERGLRPKAEVTVLEHRLQVANGDVHQLRDTLMAAVHSLITPRRLPTSSANPSKMTAEAIEAMKQKRQMRLRRVVYDCLQGIWRSGVGGEVLKHAMDAVQKLIVKFECREDDVRMALSGSSWFKLKELVHEIEGELPETIARRRSQEHEGKGHKKLIQKALDDLGGSASTAEIVQWVENHPEAVEDEDCKLNKNTRDPKGKSKYTVWHSTLRSVLSVSFSKSQVKRADGVYVWYAKGCEAALEDRPVMPALEDGSADAGSSASAMPNPGRRQEGSGGNLPLEDAKVVAAGGASDAVGQPVAQPVAEGQTTAAGGSEPVPKRARTEPEGAGEEASTVAP